MTSDFITSHRLTAAVLAALVVAGCQAGSGDHSASTPSPSPSGTEPAAPIAESQSPEPESEELPESGYAEECVKGNRRLTNQFFRLIENPPPFTEEAARATAEELAEIAQFFALNAGAMELELEEEEGPVARGDDCLALAALGLKLIADVWPSAADRRKTAQRSCRHLRSLLRYYPDSKHVASARQDMADLAC